ncbi:MAG: ABC transporter [Azospira oryzae]|nr:MAG: ABC transporter [Azospira oryzae]PZP80883.1 MAG: ABC transporter [Azospira oryzae]
MRLSRVFPLIGTPHGVRLSGGVLLELAGVRAGYGAPVVGPISFSVAWGEVVGLWGRNGSGKTTLLNAIAGAARVFDGRIVKPESARLAYQRQNAPPVAGLPVCAQDLIDLTGAHAERLPAFLKPMLRARLDTLSGGQRQFFQVWACLAAPADLVLLDEPTNHLDPWAETALAEALRSLGPDRAVLLVSHERDFLDRVCHRIVEIG